MKSIFFFMLFIIISAKSQSQSIIYADSISKITEMERQNYTKNLKNLQIAEETNFNVTYQRMEWQINPEVDSIKGCITTFFKITEANVTSISFDLEPPLSIDSIIYKKKKINYNFLNSKLKVLFTSSFNLNSYDSVSVYYKGIPVTTGYNAYEKNYHATVPIIWTLSEPYGAKTWWPCKQSLNDKIDSIDIIVTTPKIYRTAANGVLISETVNGQKRVCHWKHNHPIAAYLVAFASTNYNSYTDWVTFSNKKTMPIINYVYPENQANAQLQTPAIIPVITLFSDLFIPYPYQNEKYGHAQFGWGGGMEHQTMSFMYHFDASLMAHELAHQWFGDYITCRSWKDIWLNEGFATYLTALCDEKLGSAEIFPNWLISTKNNIMKYPSGSVYVLDTLNVNRIFDSRLSYNKGAYVLHMLRKEMGDINFFTALNNYLKDPKLANGYATTNDLKRHCELVINKPLDVFFGQWIYGEGYPLYNISWYQDQSGIVSLKVDQTTSHPSISFFEMHLPIKFSNALRDTLIYFENTQLAQEFKFKLPFLVQEVVFDPANNLLAKSAVTLNTITSNKTILIDVFPNPAGNYVIINIDRHFYVKSAQVFNMNGQIVIDASNQTGIQQKITLNISTLPKGIYLTKLQTTSGMIIKRFIKE